MPRVLRRILRGELSQHRIARIVAVAVVDSLEVVDVDEKDRQRLAAQRGIVEQRAEMARHVASVVQPGERVENRHLDAMFEPHAQMIDVALALDLGARPCQQLVGVDRAHDVVVDPHIEAPQQPRIVSRLDEDEHRQMARPVDGANLRAKPQTVRVLAGRG